MGCFNAVCNLSGLQIYHGDRIKLIVNLPSNTHHEAALVGVSDLRIPCFLPINGKYDDYGCIESVEEDVNTVILDSYFKEAKVNGWLRPTDRFRDQYERDNHGVTRWLKHIGCEGFKVTRYPNGSLKKKTDGVFMSYSLILKDVWDSYLAAFDKGKSINKRVQTACDQWCEWYKKIAQKVIENPDQHAMEWSASRWGRDAHFSPDLSGGIPKLPDTGLLQFMSDYGRDADTNWFTDLYFNNFLQPMFMAGEFETKKGQEHWDWYKQVYSEFMVMCSLMNTIPVFWLPSMTAGQDRNYELNMALAAAKHKIAKKRLDKHKKENGE